ncbi:DNA-deoxyinosine glycosylase [Catenisphaera adipataccumulans]|jgi:TDG/mug DNA glycosylase family protein|uniref:Hypoxanthine-DNA glycosylase n=1 Tax=Catenisphaera adipataccumulans TaxID=700500 RepID=A0A7W8CXG8_9FIRM|nr:DNA-deoxyinosine glycosylase [Catenisphaera adipataccumulans]MBB5183435.1 hypoxanthine-DNA glycosylase [Catenisphaera adipataccumulans]
MQRIVGLDPIVHDQDRILILGSMPSEESLRQQEYYANPTNRFWKVLGTIYQMPIEDYDQKKQILTAAKISLWDICHSCTRYKSADATIKNVEPNEIPVLAGDKKIICNGKTSYNTLKKYFPELAERAAVCPSTSAANARFRLNDLIEIYRKELR